MNMLKYVNEGCRYFTNTDDSKYVVIDADVNWNSYSDHNPDKITHSLLDDFKKWPHLCSLCDPADFCDYAENVSAWFQRYNSTLEANCDAKNGRVVYPHLCARKLTGWDFVEVIITFILTLMSLGLTGVLAIGEAKSGVDGNLHQSCRYPSRVPLGYILLCTLPWLSSLSLAVILMFGYVTDLILPWKLWILLVCDAFGQVAANEGYRHVDACRPERRFSGVSSIATFRTALVQVMITSMVRLSVLLFIIPGDLARFAMPLPAICGAIQVAVGSGLFMSATSLVCSTAPPE